MACRCSAKGWTERRRTRRLSGTDLDAVPPHPAEELARLKAEFGYALLFDAHSIRSVIPHLFDGKLPDFNLGTFNGASCDPELARRLQAICALIRSTPMC
jgi:hypothetical protein